MSGLDASWRRQQEVLLVGDSTPDAEAVDRALDELGGGIHLSRFEDGLGGMAFLRREGRSGAAARPTLILLDLNQTPPGGCGVLAEIKARADLRSIPVVVLTATDADCDIAHIYALHANCCIVKPLEQGQLLDVLRATLRFWLTTVTLPPVH